MDQIRLNEFIGDFLINLNQVAYIEEARGTYMLLQHFSDFFRYATKDADSVTLYNEFDILIKYITIQRMKFGERYSIEIENKDAYKSVYIEHYGLIAFFDMTLTKALEDHEGYITVWVDINIDNRCECTVIVDADKGKEIYSRFLSIEDEEEGKSVQVNDCR